MIEMTCTADSKLVADTKIVIKNIKLLLTVSCCKTDCCNSV